MKQTPIGEEKIPAIQIFAEHGLLCMLEVMGVDRGEATTEQWNVAANMLRATVMHYNAILDSGGKLLKNQDVGELLKDHHEVHVEHS